MIQSCLNKYSRKISGLAFFLFASTILMSCGGSNSILDPQDFGDLEEIVAAGDFEVEHSWAFPNNANNINLIGNPNHIIVKNDSVDVFLPYFGVRHAGGNYGAEGGIIYEGPLRDYEVEENKDKGYIDLKFNGVKDGEEMNFTVTLYPNEKARTRIVSNQRAPISYEGKYRVPEDN